MRFFQFVYATFFLFVLKLNRFTLEIVFNFFFFLKLHTFFVLRNAFDGRKKKQNRCPFWSSKKSYRLKKKRRKSNVTKKTYVFLQKYSFHILYMLFACVIKQCLCFVRVEIIFKSEKKISSVVRNVNSRVSLVCSFRSFIDPNQLYVWQTG